MTFPATESGLVLLFGMPRSGTSWIGKIFDSHPRTLYRHEPDAGRRLRALPWACSIEDAEQYRSEVETFVRMLPYFNGEHAAGSIPVFKKQYRSALRHQVHNWSVVAAKAGTKILGHFPVLPMVHYDRISDLRVVWKSVVSLGRLGVILRVLPRSSGIVLLRHPCGHIASVLRGESTGKFASSESISRDYDLLDRLINCAPGNRRGLSIDYFKALHPVERIAWLWLLLNEKVIHDTRGLDNVLITRYEDACADCEQWTRKSFEFAGLDWNSQTADFIHRSTTRREPLRFRIMRGPQTNAEYYSVFKNPAEAASQWQTEMSPEDIARVYGVLRESDLLRFYPEPQAQSVCSV